MVASISEFQIHLLHGYRTIRLTINDNKIVLVGENGTGKSTVANIIYYFLTCQWNKIAEYDFKEISATINNQKINVTKQQVDSFTEQKNQVYTFRRFPRSVRQRLEFLIAGQDATQLLDNKDRIKSIAAEYDFPSRVIEEYFLAKSRQDSPSDEHLKESENNIKKLINYQVLYLPTYRRIEQDLKTIFPELDLEVTSLYEKGYYTRRKQQSYVELIEFGMEDVEATISNKMEELKDNLRNSLNNLTGTYLRDVIRETYQTVDINQLKELDESTIDYIFGRIDEKVLPKQSQKSLRDFIFDIKSKKNIKSDRKKVIAHFLLKLIDLQHSQNSKEQDVRNFVEVCNEYLVGKKIVYDYTNFQIVINLNRETENYEQLEMRMLSSGEKQIVSLFSHIHLSEITGYFVIIDEPELSLSVPWQKRFLPDIIKNVHCNGLVAVTHSPFIFQDNELNDYTHNLEEFVE
ncbi:AAA ATPase (plasmid) [Gloeocapsa sp. PCC 7428]|uniref:AAA family ATPase n=1 Tax=Gloeocapsa sp. PCC 7428 TaxID=1173026 RepID=UPI0002A5CA9B|nr:AAA family ATPase [Gloeocapsa sp. PCC 7428]AFZ33594.1 AAA ATPase [Gloeocapsa sp. PCC 7428]